MYAIAIAGTEQRFACAPEDTLVRAALRAGIAFPYECNVGQCGSCRFEVVDGQAAMAWPEAPALTDRDRRKGLLLGCQTRPASDCTIKVRMDPACAPLVRPAMREVELVGVRDLTHDMREFRFRGEGPADFRPGHYALLYLPGLDAPRAYSMSNLPNAGGEWEFLVKRVPGGRGTAALFDGLRPGSRIGLDAPYGLAWLREDTPRDIVCIAGGSGLAPLVSISRGVAASAALAGRKVSFFFGGRGPADICGEDYLRLLPGYGEHITYRAAISMPELDTARSWTGFVGFVHETVEHALGDRLADYEYYIAGPPPMLQASLQMLVMRHKVPVGQVHFDRFF